MIYAEESMSHNASLYDWTDGGTLPASVRVRGLYTLDDLRAILEHPDSGIPSLGYSVEFSKDSIQFGKLLNKRFEECLIMRNAEHLKDYFSFVFTVRPSGNATSIGLYRSGFSTRNYQSNLQQERKARGGLFGNIASALTKVDDVGFDEENGYYEDVAAYIRNLLGI